MYGWRAKVGIAIPCKNTTMEPEFNRLALQVAGLGVHCTRMHLESSDAGGLTREALLEMESSAMPTVISELAHAEVGVIVYGCTSGSFVGGPGWDQEIVAKIQMETGVPATTSTTAAVAALQALKVRTVALGAPYDDEITELGKRFLEQMGFEVVSALALDIMDDLSYVPQGLAYQLGRKVDAPNADCVFLSCTHFPTIHAIEHLESDLGKPVISANLASFWHALQILPIHERVSGHGRLLEGLGMLDRRPAK